jgi:uroporphyrin-III C-methyltransferase/precorrin-2 dehydrogenase/sirohydrochlorin ferrochelatase
MSMKSQNSYFPIVIRIGGEKALVVGAGAVAGRKIRSLLACGAYVTVVAKRFSAEIRRLARHGAIRAVTSPFREDHLQGMGIAFAATSDTRVNRAVSLGAKRRGIPVNVADSPDDCSFLLPAIFDGDGFTVAISTGGENPGAARAIREFLEDHREEISVRVERGRRRGALRGKPGRVYIVGAGPGDPDLLTVRALGLLRRADVVIHDYLVPEEILSLAPRKAKRVCYSRRGRTSGHGSRLTQQATHWAMARFAREGKSVVRLKSGDPLIFGRGGEEAEFLASEQIPFEIVPGITAAVGCAAAANLPLTHRDLSSSVTFLAGHESSGKEGLPVDWRRIPRNGTIAIYMGISRVLQLERDLVRAGFPPDTPFAIVESGTRRTQRIFRGRLADISLVVRKSEVRSPAMLYLGNCVAAMVKSGATSIGRSSRGEKDTASA